MISKQKKIVYGSVLVGSVGLLVTQILARGSSESAPPPLEVPAAGPTASAPGASGAAHTVTTIAGDGSDAASSNAAGDSSSNSSSQAAVPGDGTAEVGDVLAKLEHALGNLRNFQPGALRPALDQLVQPPPETQGGTTPSDGGQTPTLQVELPEVDLPRLEDVDPREPPPPPLDVLRAQLAAQPLCGIIHGERDSAAMFGGRIVRVGDQLVPGDATITAIEPKAVRVTFLGGELRIELPPFQARSRSSKSQSDESEQSSDEQTKGDEQSAGSDSTSSGATSTESANGQSAQSGG